jgi:hypothetical protein
VLLLTATEVLWISGYLSLKGQKNKFLGDNELEIVLSGKFGVIHSLYCEISLENLSSKENTSSHFYIFSTTFPITKPKWYI